MAGKAAETPGEKQAFVLQTLDEIDFVEIRQGQERTPHRSVHVEESFYFNPNHLPTIVENQEKVGYIAVLVSPGRYFVTKPRAPSEFKQYYTIRINNQNSDTKIGIYQNDVLPIDNRPASEWPDPTDDLYKDIEKRVDLLENTHTRTRALQDLPTLHQRFAKQDLKTWCEAPAKAVYIDAGLDKELNEVKDMLCENKVAAKQ